MLLHSQYTNDETCYYLQIFALLMLIDYIPHVAVKTGGSRVGGPELCI